MSTRTRTRKFDHDQARARHAAGEKIGALAAEYGVSWTAVQFAVSDEALARNKEAQKKYAEKKGRCDDCGGPMSRHSRNMGSTRCKPCSYKALAKVEDGQAYCPNCGTWKALDQFSPSSHRIGRLVHGECRACDTARRQRRRLRHKEPCVDCGRPALPPSEKGTSGAKTPRCRACFYVWQALPEQREAARQRELARRARSA